MNSDPINIEGIDRVRLLQALHNNTEAIGMGKLRDIGRDMTYAEAAEFLDGCATITIGGQPTVMFDYVHGRPIKVQFSETHLHRADLYDRDAPGGDGTAARLVEELRSPQNAQKSRG